MKDYFFAEKIIAWYHKNKRDLPWRGTRDPYRIWLSEVILQQTRVKQGLPYYERFLAAYPDVFALASATEAEVLRLWQGLGYYSRARNLHACAREIVNQHHGKFPKNYAGLLKLKGVGDYTAAAIASFAYNQTVAVLDGNVFRVLARVFGIDQDILSSAGQKTFKQIATDQVPQGQADQYNQAIMEFGALQCTPQSPACLLCPVSDMCYAFQHNAQKRLPVKIKKVKVRKRYLSYIVIRQGKHIYMQPRLKQDIWKSLYEFYLLETPHPVSSIEDLPDDQLLKKILQAGHTVEMSDVYRHQLTHQQLFVRFFVIDTKEKDLANSLIKGESLQLYSPEEVRKLPKPILIDNYLGEVIF